MRKVVVLEHLSLDGVIQGPGGPDEDTSDGFTQGGWISAFADTVLGGALWRQMSLPFDLLLGRRTYDIWAPYWPHHGDAWPRANAATKYVASNSLTSGAWQPTVVLRGDVAGEVARLKQQAGPDLHVWGSGVLVQTLLRHDLVDAFWLMIYPITLGAGKRLFSGGAIPMTFRVTESVVTAKGVIVAAYSRGGTPEDRSAVSGGPTEP